MQQGLCNGTVSIHLLSQHSAAAAGLLLWAPQLGNIDQLRHNASAAGAAAFRSISAAAQPVLLLLLRAFI